MADNKIEIEIVLDDGKIVKGLANLKSGVEKVAKGGEKAGDSIKDAFSGTQVGSFAIRLATLNPIVAGVTAAVAGLAGAFKSALAGEEINRINKQFDLLAQQAGLSGDAISAGLITAADGLADTEDILKSASEGIVALGENAARLPEVFELARKAAVVFGGDAVSRFEQINQAIANGSSRQLKSIGIVVDSEKSYKEFAATLGLTSDQLTVAQKQQALLNSTLDVGKKSFSGVEVESNNLANSYQRLKVSIGEVFDSTAISSNNNFGQLFAGVLTSISNSLNEFNVALKKSNGEIVSSSEQISTLKTEYERLSFLIKSNTEAELAGALGASAGNGVLAKRVLLLREEISALEAGARARTDAANEAAFQRALKSTTSGASAGGGLSQEQIDAVNAKKLQSEIAFNQQLLAVRTQATNAQLQNAQLVSDEEARLAELKKVREQEIANENLLNLINQQNIEKQLRDDKLITEQQANALLEQEEIRHREQLKAIREKDAAANKATATDLNKTIQNVVAGGISNVIQRTVLALKNGQNAFSAFGKAVGDLFGDLAIQIGQFFIAAGVAKLTFVKDAAGPPTIAAGAALVALGSIIKAVFGGGGGASASVSPTSPAGGGDSFPDSTSAVETIQEKQTKVSIDVQGTVLDPVSVGKQIAQILNDTFDATGTRVVTA